MKICFLARSLTIGGAERQLALLANRLQREGHEVSVAVYYVGGVFERNLRDAGVQVIDLEKRGPWEVLPFLLRVIRTVRTIGPDVVYAFLQGPNLVTALIKPWFRQTPMIWGVRASDLDLRNYGWHTRLANWLACRLSCFADLIICNSIAGMRHAASSGFPPHKMIVIPNGVDTQRFKPDPDARARVRREWGIGHEKMLVGMVARLDPMKDHPTFLRSAGILAKARPDLCFVCVGDGPDPYRSDLRNLAQTLGLEDRLVWVSAQNDAPAVYNAIDILALSSKNGEGFSNVIGEAMATGIPCVATDVGDVAEIVGDAGRIVPPGAPDLLAQELLGLISELGEKRIGVTARERIASRYSVERMVRDTERALDGLLAERVTAGRGPAGRNR